ncbi:50S ribosomal protein L4 [bacterium]|nr:50S ribosomal protein L4 [bacterium]
MPSIAIKNISGEAVGNVELSDAVFAAPQNAIVVREAVNAHLANRRQGTASSKERGDVRGGGKKPWKQKGTGRARAGTTRSPLWRGGAIIFGPHPRDYSQKINRKKNRAALRAVLSARVEGNGLHIVDQIDLASEPKTSRVVALIDALGIEEGRVLFVTEAVNESLMRAARNIPYADVEIAGSISVYDLLIADHIVATRAAVEQLQEMFQ